MKKFTQKHRFLHVKPSLSYAMLAQVCLAQVRLSQAILSQAILAQAILAQAILALLCQPRLYQPRSCMICILVSKVINKNVFYMISKFCADCKLERLSQASFFSATWVQCDQTFYGRNLRRLLISCRIFPCKPSSLV